MTIKETENITTMKYTALTNFLSVKKLNRISLNSILSRPSNPEGGDTGEGFFIGVDCRRNSNHNCNNPKKDGKTLVHNQINT